MLARTWRGATRSEDADAYLAYLQQTGLAAYRATPGNQGVIALRRSREGKAEFLLISFWESEAAIRRFAGEEPERAVFYAEDERFLVEKEERVQHFEVAFTTGFGSP
jgi:heme-degrading monooxygenase HmoA